LAGDRAILKKHLSVILRFRDLGLREFFFTIICKS
jgi:hypothetical protein